MRFIIMCLIALASTSAHAQILIAPTAVYIGDKATSTTIQLINPSTEDREVTLRLAFGYPRTDTSGSSVVEYTDTTSALLHSCAEWVSVFPRRFVLKAGQRQTVRITGRPNGQLDDGIYWARLIASTSTTSNIATPNTSDAVGAQIRFSFNQVVPVTFRRGTPTLEVTTTGLLPATVEGRSTIVLPLSVSGNGAYIGTIACDATPVTGGPSKQLTMPVSVYFAAHKRVGDLFTTLSPGAYDVRMHVRPTKEDVAPTLLASANDVVIERRVSVDANGNVRLDD